MNIRLKKFRNLVFFLLFGLVFLSISPSALAASPISIVDIPRMADDNYRTTGWNHSALTFQNGWSMPASQQYYFFSVFSFDGINGKVAYCIAPGIPLMHSSTDLEQDNAYFASYPEELNPLLTNAEMKQLVEAVLSYGYYGNINSGWNSGNATHYRQMSQQMATQILLYEVIMGERDANFNYCSPPGGYNAAFDIVTLENILRAGIVEYYDQMVADIKAHYTYPSFMDLIEADASIQQLIYDGTNWTLTLTDDNDVLADFVFSSSNSNVSFSAVADTLTISSTEPFSGNLLITATAARELRPAIAYSDGEGPQAGAQDQVTSGSAIARDISAYLKIATTVEQADRTEPDRPNDSEGSTTSANPGDLPDTTPTTNLPKSTESTEVPPESSRQSPEEYLPGGDNPDLPPNPTVPGNRLVAEGDGWLEIDDNDVPLGKWEWGEEEKFWIFDEAVPLTGAPYAGSFTAMLLRLCLRLCPALR
jgi:hypothetical protein